MKADALTDACIEEPNTNIVIQLPNGQRVGTTGWRYETNAKGEWVILIITSKKFIK